MKPSTIDDLQKARAFANQNKEECNIEVKKKAKHRSQDANAYFWTLCGKLAACLRLPKEQVYRDLIKEIGDNFQMFPIKNEAVDEWVSVWQSRGLGWICDIAGPSKLPGYTNVVSYYGSSVYDTRLMSILIDAVVFECKEQGIETLTEKELSRMKEEWK